MGAPTPQFIPEAFAISAAPSDRNTIPTAPVTTQRASFDLGFPPLTMTPVVAGGKPMLGPDMNGILYMMSTHTVYAQSGQPYQYNSAVATAIGGYAVGTLLGMADGSGVWLNQTINNTADPDVGGAGWIPINSYGYALVGGLIGGITTLTPLQYRRNIIVLSGALIANQQVVLPSLALSWLIVNQCTGAFTLTVKTAGGNGVVVPAGGYASPTAVYSDGTNINLVFAPAALPIDVNPVASTIPLRDNTGRVLSVTPNIGDSTTYTATSEYVQHNMVAGDDTLWQAFIVGTDRINGVVYTNTTGRPIQVLISGDTLNGGTTSFIVDGVTIFINVNGGTITEPVNIAAIIPAGSTYQLTGTTLSPGFHSWAELR